MGKTKRSFCWRYGRRYQNGAKSLPGFLGWLEYLILLDNEIEDAEK